MRRNKTIPKSKRTGKYKSKLESIAARQLGRKAKYEAAKIKYFEVKTYIPDFSIRTNGNPIYVEVKGYLRYEDQRKMRMVKVSNPEMDIRFFFAQDNRVQGSKMTNSQWCDKYSFPYCIGEIPKGWLQ
jgi:predicted nuclease of restriction endonuclease-like RecB superfamily